MIRSSKSCRFNILFLVLAFAVLFAIPAPAQEEDAAQDVTRTAFPVLFVETADLTIDGDLSDWPAVLPAILADDNQLIIGRRSAQTDFSAAIRALFDAQHLYVAAEIEDATPLLNAHEGTNIWQGDCLEIYLGFHDSARNFMGDGDYQVGIALLPENQTVWNWPDGKALDHYELTVTPTDTGCVVEARIALRNFRNIAVRPGSTIWLDFALDNAVKPGSNRAAQLIWHGDGNNYRNAALWQKAVLTDDPADLDAFVIAGPALFQVKQPYTARLFRHKQPWRDTVLIGGEPQETDELGRVTFTQDAKEPVILAVNVDEQRFEKHLFPGRRAHRHYVRQASGAQRNLPPIPADARYKNAALPIDERVDDLLAYMTLEEKIGQMAQVERAYLLDLADLTDFGIGSVLSGGGSAPKRNIPAAWVAMYNTYQQAALESRLGIPLIYGIDAVHGHNNVKGATIFPHNIGLGATRDADLVERIARLTALEVSATGLDWTFAPCIAVPRDERWGRTYEGFSEDPELVAELGAAAIRGYQGEDLAHPTTILATAKHYAGDGGTTGGDDQGNTELPESEFRALHLRPYLAALDAGVGSVMASFSSWNGEKIHGSRYLLTDVLKDELGFDGLLVSDWAAVKQLPGGPKAQLEAAINAGIDMVMIPDDYMQFVALLSALVKEGAVSEARIDAAIRKILTAKFALGLFETPLADPSRLDALGAEEHRAVAREAVRKSLVLLKNNGVLPLSKTAEHLRVAGKMSKDLGSQCGGWTIAWQGQTGRITDGTTIYDAITASVSPETKVSYSRNGKGGRSADAVIVVIGEEPYAEFEGDSDTLALSPLARHTIANASQSCAPVVVVLLSGRPLIITEELEQADAWLAAWLPGTEGQGVADVLFGEYAPTGKLPYTWPRSVEQVPINLGDGRQDAALFPYGFGLTYK